jgi:hypothetical protein
MKKRIQLIIFIASISSLFVLVLYFYSARVSYKNGFDRNIITRLLSGHTIPITQGSYIAGTSSEHLYIGNINSHTLTRLSKDLSTQMTIQIFPQNIHARPTTLTVVYPMLFGREVGTNSWHYGWANSGRFSGIISEKKFLVDAIPIDTNSMLVKTWNKEKTEFVLARKSRDSITYHPELLVKQIDGKFCIDGMMTFNREREELIYVYYYRNEFFTTNSNLNLIQRYHTIDTISKARISVSPIHSEHSLSLSSPARIVNNLFTTSGDILIINSLVKADNESFNDFKSHVVLDAYDLTDGKYILTFYYPRVKDQKLREIQLIDNVLFLLYESSLYATKVNLQLPYHE